ncbi:MAG: hypothetical protein MMC33_008102 [Icmadophila ericetorum]|nr:hypothetical protein [Icmadophila ericetorum]
MSYSDYTDQPAPPYSRRRSAERDDERERAREAEPPKQETMSQWLQNQASSHKMQLAATAVVSGLVVAGAIFGAQALRRQVILEDLKASIPDVDQDQKLPDYGLESSIPGPSKEDERIAALANKARKGDYDEELIEEQLTRTSTFLTPAGLSAIRSAFVVVVGLGGVGSHCTAALARSGVSRIRLIDFDQVSLSSLNRHAVATLADVGTPKVACIKRRLEAVSPWVRWECFNEIWRETEAGRLLTGWDGDKSKKPDFVVDAIDNIDSKVALLKYCYQHNIKVISSMGAGCKSDPTRVLVGDISASTEDPLSRSTRRRLRAFGISEGIPVVYSTEKPGPGKASLLPLTQEEFQKGNVGELSVLPDFRVRILPVLGTMPAVFGLTIANYIITEISGYPHETTNGKCREKVYEDVLRNLQGLEERLAKSEGEDVVGLRIPVSKDDVGYLVDEIFHGKSVISGLSTRLALVRWRKPSGRYRMDQKWEGQKFSKLKLIDLVCVTKEEALVHEKEILRGGRLPEEVYEAEVLELVRKRVEEERELEKYR